MRKENKSLKNEFEHKKVIGAENLIKLVYFATKIIAEKSEKKLDKKDDKLNTDGINIFIKEEEKPKTLKGSSPSASFILYTRALYTQKKFKEAIKEGVKHSLILGAGYELLAMQNKGLKFAEVDFPSVLKEKQNRIEQYQQKDKNINKNAAYIPMNYMEKNKSGKFVLPEKLEETNFKKGSKLMVIWQGGSMYHSKKDNKELLQSLVNHYGPQNIRIVFDFLTKDFVENPEKVDEKESKILGKKVTQAQIVNKYAQFKTGYTEEEINNLADELDLTPESIDPLAGEIKQLLEKTGLEKKYEVPYTSKYQLCTLFKSKANKQTSDNDMSSEMNNNSFSNN